jgi:hypothetical protein
MSSSCGSKLQFSILLSGCAVIPINSSYPAYLRRVPYCTSNTPSPPAISICRSCSPKGDVVYCTSGDKRLPEMTTFIPFTTKLACRKPSLLPGTVNVPLVPRGVLQLPLSVYPSPVSVVFSQTAQNLPNWVTKPPCTLVRSPICGASVQSDDIVC